MTHLFFQILVAFTLTLWISAREIKVRPDADPTNQNNGESWENSTNLIRAISLSEPGDEIWISQGTYHPTIDNSQAGTESSFDLKGGTTFLGGFSGDETDKNQRNHRTQPTILSGDLDGDDLFSEELGFDARGSNSKNVCRVTEATETPVILDGLIITKGAPSFSGVNPGAGILCEGGKLHLKNCSFITNQSNAPKGGGAISLTDGADAILENCVFRANYCTGDGGAIYSLDSTLSLNQCELSGNYTRDDGGAIYFRSGDMTMNFCTIVGNRSEKGGGGMLLFVANVTVSNSVFWDNQQGSSLGPLGNQIIAPGDNISVEIDHSLIEGSGGSSSWQFGARNFTDLGNNLDLDPFFEEPIIFPGSSRFYEPVSLNGDFRPQANSPLLDAATTDGTEAPLDLNGRPRTFASGTDIGAFEWNGEFTPSISTIYQVTSGSSLRRSLASLRDLFPFEPTEYSVVSNSDSNFVNVSVDPANGSLAISWNNENRTGSVDLLFEAIYQGFSLRFPMTLELVAGILHVDKNQEGPSDGLSWQTAFPNLQDALAALTPNLSQSIWVAEGSYFPDEGLNQTDNSVDESFELVSGSAIYGGFSGNETSLAQRDLVTHPTVLSGDLAQNDTGQFSMQENSRSVVLIENNTETSILDGFEIVGGYVDSTRYGCNIRIDNAKALIQNMRLGRSKGIPVYVLLSPETRFTNCDFEDLAIENVAIDIGSSVFTLESSRVRGTQPNEFSRNGGFLRTSSSEVVIQSTLFTGNKLDFSLISINHGSNDAGSLIPSSATIRQCTFSGNSIRSTNFGTNPDQVVPLIRNDGRAHLAIENSIFWDNTWRGDNLRDDSLILNLSDATSSFENCIIETGFIEGLWNEKLGTDGGRNTSTNPLFIAPTSAQDAPSSDENFSLASASPAIDQGTADGPLAANDALGNPRVIGSASDLGAIEWDGSIQAPSIKAFLFSGPHGSGTIQVSLRDFMGSLPANFTVTAINAEGILSTVLDATNGVIDINLEDPIWSGSADLQYSATRENDTFTGTINVTVLPKVLHVRNATTEGRKDGLDWNNAFSSLKNALATSVKNSEQEIWISEGTYRSDDGFGEVPITRMSPFNFPSGVSLYGGFSGAETTRDQRDPSAHQTIISPPSESPGPNDEPRTNYNFLAVLEFGAIQTTILDGLIFQGERNNVTRGTHGQLLSCEASRATINNCTFLDASLGAIFASYSFDTITECRFENTPGIVSIASRHLIQSSDFNNAMISFTESSGQILQCNFSADPSREMGPAIGASRVIDAGLRVSNCSIDGYQQALTAFDDGSSYSLSPVTLENCQFNSNFSTFNGGAIRTYNLTQFLIRNCAFEGNTAENEGGALHVDGSSQVSLIEGCLFSGNKSEGSGGAVLLGGNGRCIMKNCTLTGNAAGSTGGAVSPNGGNVIYEACIITGNTSSEGYQIYPQWNSNRAMIKNSIVEGTGGSAAWSEAGLRDLGGNLDLPPLFQSPNPEPAPTVGGDYRLRFDSPAIDQASQSGGLSLDLDGSPRLSGAFVDLGAYEFQFPTIPPTSFSSAFPTLVPGDDENQNGISNFAEFAFGFDPTTQHLSTVSNLSGNNGVRFNIRPDPQIRFSYQHSSDLIHWVPLQESNDFEFEPDHTDGNRVQKSLTFTDGFRTRHPSAFFRHQPLSINPN